MRRYLSAFFVLLAFALGAVSASGATPTPAPDLRAGAGAQPIAFVADVPFPASFVPYPGVEPSIVFTRDGAHVIGVQGSHWNSKETFGYYIFKWYPGRESTARDLGRLTSGRGVLEVADSRLFAWSFEEQRLKIFQVADFIPPDDHQNAYVP